MTNGYKQRVWQEKNLALEGRIPARGLCVQLAVRVGNVRELENVLERALIISTGSTLLVEPLLDAVEPYLAEAPHRSAPAAASGVINDLVRDHIRSVLEQCHWRVKGTGAAAERLGINPSTLRYRMKTLDIERPYARPLGHTTQCGT